MKNWNFLITTNPGPHHAHDLLRRLRRFGDFHFSPFKDVITGMADDPAALLEALGTARLAGEAWTQDLARAVPVEDSFQFTPETLAGQLQQAASRFLARVQDGSCYVRLERRGMLGKINSPEIERAVADHLFAAAEQHGKRLRADFHDPDYIVAAETVEDVCGIALITRETRARYPFVQVR